MNLDQLEKRFFALVAPDLPNSWEVEDALAPLVDQEQAELILSQVPVIWPVSNSLCYNYLGQAVAALAEIEEQALPAWVGEVLDQYEAGGLRAAQQFMVQVRSRFAGRGQGRGGVQLRDIEGWLLPFAQGISDASLDIAPGKEVYTDTSTIFLPEEIHSFSREEENRLLYKLMVAFQWGLCVQGSLDPSSDLLCTAGDCSVAATLAGFLAGFADPECAARLYHGLETLRISYFLDRELPGLMRAARSIFIELGHHTERDETDILAGLRAAVCRQKPGTEILARIVAELAGEQATAANSLDLCTQLYEQLNSDACSGQQSLLPFQGQLRLAEVQAAREKQRAQAVESFVEALALYLVQLPQARSLLKKEENGPDGGDGGQGDRAIVLERDEESGQQGEESFFLTIANESAELPESLHQEIRNLDELGLEPDRFITSAVGRAGHFLARGEGGRQQEEEVSVVSQHSYDEWDFRRNGFRKNWCLLTERELPSTRSSFVQTTLGRYHGQIERLRHQFEMMRTRERFLRRRRDGDDIDLDALIESLADSRAGLPPSDRLFVRLQRDERDIAALFLVDMSNSTEGWVGTAIKESLVLLCEAMESLGDRYGIYGFSGMRRLRCEIFPIKELDEPYDNRVHRRIGAIGPREYTRMAPAIRHMIHSFAQVDARVRLLITLSDGKPEDYDDYKGEYAIEDTRHALLEAAAAGIHPFSITIDHHAHEYMEHMCGRGNYIFLDNVARLPARMPEIYRVLTT